MSNGITQVRLGKVYGVQMRQGFYQDLASQDDRPLDPVNFDGSVVYSWIVITDLHYHFPKNADHHIASWELKLNPQITGDLNETVIPHIYFDCHDASHNYCFLDITYQVFAWVESGEVIATPIAPLRQKASVT